ncbi:F-box/kelch-repeat protein At3g18720-like [Cornus florida]|uniref:F-box/kelch-repeat protein At3g18720-like n=1 Tax=Cornus florida TaxID=4283 RepID=UPI002897C214|nr:F-box/kelch-repeat protein At3g18720-like [Cornus florida]
MLSRENSSLFFFNPLSRQKIELPYRNSIFNAVTFSAPPTDPNCTIYAFVMPTFNGKLYVDTFCVSQENKKWIRHAFKPSSGECDSTLVGAICCNGVVYCVDSFGKISIFDAQESSWTRLAFAKDKGFGRVCNPYLAEFNGDIYAGKLGAHGVLDKVYKLKVDDGVTEWMELRDLDDVNLFLGPYGSCAMSSKEKKIFVSVSDCVLYNFDGDGELKKDTRFDIANSSWSDVPIWIEDWSETVNTFLND